MGKIIDLEPSKARKHFLNAGCYFRDDIPKYISFKPIIDGVCAELGNNSYRDVICSDKSKRPENIPDVNYSFIANKDGRFEWRPYELIHPVIYVSLVNTLTKSENWGIIKNRIKEFENSTVECCSHPVFSDDKKTDTATQILNWWLEFEQKTIAKSLEFTHILHTDVVNCYGSLYTHSICWAIHGFEEGKAKKTDKTLLGNIIDKHIQHGRFGQTNGISQGSTLMDFVAELVLGFIDIEISNKLTGPSDYCILRYRDDYRILAKSDKRAHEILKIVSDSLRIVGMKLSLAKTFLTDNVVSGAVKADKLAGIELRDMDVSQAKTIQKQFLRLHSFARKYPNSGALRRLVAESHEKIFKLKEPPSDINVQVAILCDIAVISPQAFPALAGMISHLLSLAKKNEKKILWGKVLKKLRQVPHNGYLEIWLQRITKSKGVSIPMENDEPICQIVNGHNVRLWNNEWIDHKKYPYLYQALDVSKIIVDDPETMPSVIEPKEIELFAKNSYNY